MLDFWSNIDEEQHFAEYCAVVEERDELRALCEEAATMLYDCADDAGAETLAENIRALSARLDEAASTIRATAPPLASYASAPPAWTWWQEWRRYMDLFLNNPELIVLVLLALAILLVYAVVVGG